MPNSTTGRLRAIVAAAVCAACAAPSLSVPLVSPSTRTLVVVMAHPDDETFVSPVLANYARAGVRVYLDLARGQYRNAIASFKSAQTIYEKVTPPSMADLSYVLYRIGLANYYQLEFEQARLHLIRSTTLLDQHPEAADPENYSRYQLAIVERRLGHFEAAKKILQSIIDESQPADPSDVLDTLLELTTIARSQGALQEANKWWARAQTAAEKIDPTELQEGWAIFHYQKAMMAFVNGKVTEASSLMKGAIEIGTSDDPLFIEYLDDYALILRRQGKDKDAVLIEQRAKQLRDRIRREKNED